MYTMCLSRGCTAVHCATICCVLLSATCRHITASVSHRRPSTQEATHDDLQHGGALVIEHLIKSLFTVPSVAFQPSRTSVPVVIMLWNDINVLARWWRQWTRINQSVCASIFLVTYNGEMSSVSDVKLCLNDHETWHLCLLLIGYCQWKSMDSDLGVWRSGICHQPRVLHRVLHGSGWWWWWAWSKFWWWSWWCRTTRV